MPSPFPGMDPYLEHPGLWPDVHHGLIGELRAWLASRVAPRYYVRVEARVYVEEPGEALLVGIPGAAAGPGPSTVTRVVSLPVPETITERYLEIRRVETGQVVTVIEVLSPANKVPGAGCEEYLAKRQGVLATRTSLGEIDLLRAGERMPVSPEGEDGAYRIVVAAGRRRPLADLIAWGLRDPIPEFLVPLGPGDADVPVSLKGILDSVYDRARYELQVDYRTEPVPSLAAEDVHCVRTLIA